MLWESDVNIEIGPWPKHNGPKSPAYLKMGFCFKSPLQKENIYYTMICIKYDQVDRKRKA